MEIIEPDNPAANLPDNARALALQKALLQQGVIIRISEHGRGNVVEIRPALICTDSDIAEILQRFEQACAGIHA
jgi:4-aminobutyrate aminotransferase